MKKDELYEGIKLLENVIDSYKTFHESHFISQILREAKISKDIDKLEAAIELAKADRDLCASLINLSDELEKYSLDQLSKDN